jgi:hypothetical protein
MVSMQFVIGPGLKVLRLYGQNGGYVVHGDDMLECSML